MKTRLDIGYLDWFLSKKFGYDGWIYKCKVLEIACYNPKTGIYIVIDDGCSWVSGDDDDDFWVCHSYKFESPDEGMKFMLSEYKHPIDIAESVEEFKITTTYGD